MEASAPHLIGCMIVEEVTLEDVLLYELDQENEQIIPYLPTDYRYAINEMHQDFVSDHLRKVADFLDTSQHTLQKLEVQLIPDTDDYVWVILHLDAPWGDGLSEFVQEAQNAWKRNGVCPG
jgi:hypothetical protein